MRSTDCPSENDLAALLDGTAPLDAAMQRHVGECDDCRALTAELLRLVAPPSNAPVAGRKIGVYELEAELGRGGMGIVFRAHDTKLRRKVAIKFLSARLLGHVAAMRRFRREAEAAAAMHHPNIAVLYEAGDADGLHYLVFELVEGQSLAQRMANGALTESEALPILIGLVRGVAAAHQAGIVHRDLKPANVMVQPDGTVKLLDFGLASLDSVDRQSSALLTLSREVLGTLAYMAPEQHTSANADPRVDLWAIGAVAYHLLSGTPPLGSSPGEIGRALATGGARPLRQLAPTVSASLATLVHACLQELPEDRPRSTQALLDDLERMARGESISVHGPSSFQRLRGVLRRQRGVVAVAVSAFVLLVAGGGYSIVARQRLAEDHRRAREIADKGAQLRASLRNAKLLPLHDIRPMVKAVLASIDNLKVELATASANTELRAICERELGEELMALDVDRLTKEALPHLLAAWSSGDRNPDLAAGLGIATMMIYESKMGKARRDPDLESRTARLVDTDHVRDKAVEYLRSATGATDTTAEYVAAQIAYLDHHYRESAELAHTAFEHSQSLYEAGILEARTRMLTARERIEAGDKQAAKELLAQSIAAYEHVMQIARSDDAMRMQAGEAFRDIAALVSPTDSATGAAYNARGLVLVEESAQINPDNPEAHTMIAEVYMGIADTLAAEEKDPTDAVTKGIEEASRAIALDPTPAQPLGCRATLHSIRFDQIVAKGGDPRAEFDAGIRDYLASLKLTDHPQAHLNLGALYAAMAEWSERHGHAVRELREKAFEQARLSAAADWELSHWGQLPAAYTSLAYYDMTHGRDASELLEKAIAAGNVDLAANKMPRIRRHLAGAWLAKASNEQRHGIDESAAIANAVSLAQSAAAEEPDSTTGLELMQAIDLLQMRALLFAHRTLDNAVTSQRVHAQQTNKVSPHNLPTLRNTMAAQCIIARAAMFDKRWNVARAALAAARATAVTTLAIDPDGYTLTGAAEIERLSATNDLADGKRAAALTALAAANALLDRALANGASLAAAHAERSFVLRLAAAGQPEKLSIADRELTVARAEDPEVDFIDRRLASSPKP